MEIVPQLRTSITSSDEPVAHALLRAGSRLKTLLDPTSPRVATRHARVRAPRINGQGEGRRRGF